MAMTDAVVNKLEAARTRLILDQPFLGALVLRLPMRDADPLWCPTTATDAREFYFNPEFIGALSLAQTEFVLAHEALHCALSHFARREHRNKLRWDVACDYAINPLLLNAGLTAAPGTLADDGFADMTAEEIYPYIEENTDDEPLDRHLYDGEQSAGGSGQDAGEQPPGQPESGPPPPLTETERQALDVQWRQRMAGAANQARAAGKLSADFARLVDELLQPRLPWRALLARYVTAAGRDDYSYMRPARREGAAILPSRRSAQIDIAVAVDTSGSIAGSQVTEFLSEVDAIKGALRARVTLLACDAQLHPDCPWTYEPWEPCTLPADVGGGGGTRFTPVFDWLETRDVSPDLAVYFTDAEGEFPDTPPYYPVLWLIKGRRPVPFGQRIQLN